LRLFDALWVEPRSAKDLADWLGLPADRLYYHLHQLQQARLIEVASYRELPTGRVERVYSIAHSEPPGDAATPEEIAEFLGQTLEATRAEITQAFAARANGRERHVTLTRSGARLSRAHVDELRAHFEELARAAAERPDEDGVWTRVLFALVDLEDRSDSAADGPHLTTREDG
jgi:predicted ArsR family transcriptional regulator